MYFVVTDDTHKESIVNLPTAKEANKYNGRSRGYKTLRVLKANEELLSTPCHMCGGVVRVSFIEPVRSQLIEHGLCFGCNHWRKLFDRKDEPNIARVDGSHYTIHPDAPDAPFQGYGGRLFEVRFHDGRVVETRNMWCQGDISPSWKDLLPDNATFKYI